MSVTADPVSRSLAGIPLRVTTPEAAVRRVCEIAANTSEPTDVHLVNAYTIGLADNDDSFRSVLTGAVANLPDGKPLAIVTKNTHQPLCQVRGPGLFEDVLDCGRKYGLKHYFLGSTEPTLAALVSQVKYRFPGIEIAGTYSPPFRALSAEEIREQDQMVADSGADIVWVGLGTPKQDFEGQRLAHSVSCVTIAIGAAFDFMAGTKKEAPVWMRRAGLEWLFRFASEPRRLWKRYLIGNAAFLHAILRRRR